jgi:hypothetical protein
MEVQGVASVYAADSPADAFCSVCGDKFEAFFNDEMEERQLRAAVRVDGKTFHPLCCGDYKVSIFFMMLCLLLEMLFCHFDKMQPLSDLCDCCISQENSRKMKLHKSDTISP